MAQLQIYSKGYVYLNGNLFVENASVKMARNAGLLPVKTTYKGFAGVVQGSPMITIDIEEAVPVAGFELNSQVGQFEGGASQGGGSAVPNSAPSIVNLRLVCAGQSLSSDGFIMTDDISYAENGETKLNFHFEGEWSDWQ